MRDQTDDRYAGGGYFDNANPYIERLLEPAHRRVLEVGCGAAALGGRWKAGDPAGREVWGIELDERAAAVASARVDRVLVADLDRLEDLPAPDGGFDLITFGDVLEHLRDPGRLLARLAGHLSPHGEVVACVPNVGHWSVVAQLLAGRFDYADEGLLDRTHIHLFTPGTFRELLAAHGLATVTHEERITTPAPLAGALADLAAALAGDPSSREARRADLETYQMVFRARPALAGPPVGLLVDCGPAGGPGTAGLDPEAEAALSSYLGGFRAGEPVRLVLAVGGTDPSPGGPVHRTLARIEEVLNAHPTPLGARAEVEAFLYAPDRPLASQLRGGDRWVAAGARAAAALPGVPPAAVDRAGLLAAARAGGGPLGGPAPRGAGSEGGPADLDGQTATAGSAPAHFERKAASALR